MPYINTHKPCIKYLHKHACILYYPVDATCSLCNSSRSSVSFPDFATCTVQADPRAPYKLTGAVRFAQTDVSDSCTHISFKTSQK